MLSHERGPTERILRVLTMNKRQRKKAAKKRAALGNWWPVLPGPKTVTRGTRTPLTGLSMVQFSKLVVDQIKAAPRLFPWQQRLLDLAASGQRLTFPTRPLGSPRRVLYPAGSPHLVHGFRVTRMWVDDVEVNPQPDPDPIFEAVFGKRDSVAMVPRQYTMTQMTPEERFKREYVCDWDKTPLPMFYGPGPSYRDPRTHPAMDAVPEWRKPR